MKYVIQHNLINTDQVEEIRQVVINHNLPHVFVSIIPFTREIICDELLDGVNYIQYGSTTLTMETYRLGWRGQYFNPVRFHADVWNTQRSDMLNSDAMVVPIVQAIDYLRSLDTTTDIFIRPAEDLKQFSGQVIQASEAADWLTDAMECASSGSYQLALDTAVVVAPPKNIQAEWRWFVVGGRVISGAMYRCRGKLIKEREEDSATIAEAQTFADVWLPSPCCVMDLALVDNQLKVIEFNTINSSGFYNHDVEAIFVELYKYSAGN